LPTENNLNEYYLLKNAQENVSARGFLLKVDFVSLEEIEQGNWKLKIPNTVIPLVRNCIQMDIISKIMMYIEDVVVLAESFINKKNFYDEFLSPSSGDLGGAIKCFFRDIDKLSNDEILKIMSWTNIFSGVSNIQFQQTVDKILNFNITNIRKFLEELRDFGESNHPVYKRFKHGGMPITPTTIKARALNGPLAAFDNYSVVSVGEDPLHDIQVVPFSNAILQRYQNLIDKIQVILLEMIKNRIACIRKDITGVFPKRYPIDLSQGEVKSLDKAIQDCYDEHPEVFMPLGVNLEVNLQEIDKRIKWYLETYEYGYQESIWHEPKS